MWYAAIAGALSLSVRKELVGLYLRSTACLSTGWTVLNGLDGTRTAVKRAWTAHNLSRRL